MERRAICLAGGTEDVVLREMLYGDHVRMTLRCWDISLGWSLGLDTYLFVVRLGH